MVDVQLLGVLRPFLVCPHPLLDGPNAVMDAPVSDAPAAEIVHAPHHDRLQHLNDRVMHILVRPQSRLRYVPPLSGALVPASRKPRLVRLVTACNDLPQLFYIAVNVRLHPCHCPVWPVVRMEAVCHVHGEDRQPQVFFRYQLWK